MKQEKSSIYENRLSNIGHVTSQNVMWYLLVFSLNVSMKWRRANCGRITHQEGLIALGSGDSGLGSNLWAFCCATRVISEWFSCSGT